ncbi:hypothetical protein KC19_11G047100 [Ceratodon purpureus]|uniref:Subtilisin-like protease n=1 Tax=Ceratodon purpureus TaxID=3225 RepID=A0A8T0GAI0_CERPU|nr:hypothetical protein KC19_11G047100 [Ceratodon purpureus]
MLALVSGAAQVNPNLSYDCLEDSRKYIKRLVQERLIEAEGISNKSLRIQVMSITVQHRRHKMDRIAARIVLLGLWMLVAGHCQGQTSPVHIDLNDRRLLAPTAEEYHGDTWTYIVHMDKSPTHSLLASLETPLSRYSQLLQTLKQDMTLVANGEPATLPIHVYSSVCQGFSARLTSQEAAALRTMTGVLAVYPDTIRYPHTTRTPEFLGLSSSNGLWPNGHFGDDVIVGVLDTGVWPERDSFSDAGLGPVPARWKGICETGKDFNASHCNNKLIGARYFVAGYETYLMSATGKPLNESLESRSPRDTEGHGSHTASTAAGSEVPGASLFGLANGTARGMAPKARIAVYKICWAGGCFASDTLAAFDQAVADGVDIISLSVGGSALEYFADAFAIGAFGAMEKGVFVSCSGGNDGPGLETVSNVAPWMMTVAASTIDRDFPANVILGDGQILQGQSLYTGKGLSSNVTQMITGAAATTGNVTNSALCLPGSLKAALVKGKIVVCKRGPNRVAKGAVVLAAGGVGMILYNGGADGGVLADSHFLPATHVDMEAGVTLLAYMNSTATPVGNIEFLGTRYNVKAPIVAGFSSRGPNIVTPQVPKPDITAPGVNILAAWTGAVGPSSLESDTRRVDFNIISGTSMSCPHISGLGALLKAAHPDWSPAAIKSAMMTTATFRDRGQVDVITDEFGGAQATPFQYGSGHVRPEMALDPGLVYDLGFKDYVNFLCASNYTALDIQIFTSTHNETVTCPVSPVRVEDLNYPSFAAIFTQPPSLLSISMNMTRTVTNVGNANATYMAQTVQPANTVIKVYPDVLSFSALNEKKSFTVEVTTVNAPSATESNIPVFTFGYLVWTDGVRAVQSPISITVFK